VNRNGGEVVEVEAFRPLALNHAGQHRHAGEQCTVPPILPPQDGYRFLDRAKFHTSFAADVSEAKAAFMADSQVPWGVNAVSGAVTEPAWKTKPSWYLVATEDKMIPPPAQRQMATRAGATVEEAAGSHAIYISKPETVAALIAKAARA
jgi:pimeloyl-ACP methyl ester carboxylesterase